MHLLNRCLHLTKLDGKLWQRPKIQMSPKSKVKGKYVKVTGNVKNVMLLFFLLKRNNHQKETALGWWVRLIWMISNCRQRQLFSSPPPKVKSEIVFSLSLSQKLNLGSVFLLLISIFIVICPPCLPTLSRESKGNKIFPEKKFERFKKKKKMSDALINGLAGAGGGIIAQLITYPLQTVQLQIP